MQQQAGGVEPVKVEFDNFEHGFPEGFGPGAWGHLAYAIGLAFAVFQLYVAAFNYLPSQVVRGVHVGFLVLLTFGLIGNFTARNDVGRALGWIVGGAGFYFGPFLGAMIAVLLPEWLRFTEGYYLMLYAVAVMGLLIWSPTGILGILDRTTAARRTKAASALRAVAKSRLETAQ